MWVHVVNYLLLAPWVVGAVESVEKVEQLVLRVDRVDPTDVEVPDLPFETLSMLPHHYDNVPFEQGVVSEYARN